MTFRKSGLILSAVALIGLGAPSFAVEMTPKHHKHAHAYVHAYSPYRPNNNNLFPGAVTDVGSDDRYFSDTRQTPPNQLGSGISQKFQIFDYSSPSLLQFETP
jgi:hypothetical protein